MRENFMQSLGNVSEAKTSLREIRDSLEKLPERLKSKALPVAIDKLKELIGDLSGIENDMVKFNNDWMEIIEDK